VYFFIKKKADPYLNIKTVLIIEDEAIIAMDLARTFHALGAREVKITPSAAEGLAWLCQKKPDLILIDIKLRGSMDGIEAARIIQNQGPFNLIYITAYNDEATLKRASQIPHAGIIIKPFTSSEILKLFPSLNSQL